MTGWRLAPSMQTARSEISAAYLGGKIVVAGGIGFLRTLKSTEIFDTNREAWLPGPDLPRALHHVALASDEHRVFAAGGFTTLRFTPDRAPKLWALEDGAWQEIADLPEPIGEHVLVHAAGRLFLIGGRTSRGDSDRVWVLDEASQLWSPRAPLPAARQSMAAVVVKDEIWVLGGRSEALGSAIDRVDVYEIHADRWRTAPPLPQGRGGHMAAACQGRIHVFGGEVFSPSRLLDRHDVFDLEHQKWTSAPPPPRPRHGGAAIATARALYVIGGAARPRKKTLYTMTGTTQSWEI